MNSSLERLIVLTSEAQRRFSWLPATLARFTVGWVFAQSGWGKVHNLEGVIGYFSSLGIPAPELQAPLVAWIELLGGAMILAGLATRVAAFALVVVMIVALRTALMDQISEWSDVLGLAEFCYIVLLAGLIVHGAGPVSVDALLARRLLNNGRLQSARC